MDLRYVDSFIRSSVDVIREMVGLETEKGDVYVMMGKESLGGVSIFLRIEGDIDGQIIFDLPMEMANEIGKRLVGINLGDGDGDGDEGRDEDKENANLFKSALKELGNTISGNAIMNLEEEEYHCTIGVPKFHIGSRTRLTSPYLKTVVIEMRTSLGNFLINLVNKRKEYGGEVNVLLINIDSGFEEDIGLDLISKGFCVEKADSLGGGVEILKKKGVDFIVMDVDWISESFEVVMGWIRQESKEEEVKVILHSYNRDLKFLKSMRDLGVNGYILKSLNSEQRSGKLEEILRRLGVDCGVEREGMVLRGVCGIGYVLRLGLEGGMIEGDVMELGLRHVIFKFNGLGYGLMAGRRVEGIELDLKGVRIICNGVVESVESVESLVESLIEEGGREVRVRLIEWEERFLGLMVRVIFEYFNRGDGGVIDGGF